LPGTIGKVGTILGNHGINIFGMQMGRRAQHGPALMILNLDQSIPDAIVDEIRRLPGFFDVQLVRG
jgi:predicted regulator of amino acid metabolism with ACT domain